jgi:hypothetical protein
MKPKLILFDPERHKNGTSESQREKSSTTGIAGGLRKPP